jgi:Flp pilus assembly protein TadD
MIMAALLAGCAKHQEQFSADPPSLHVGEVALTAGEPTIALSVANERLSLTPNEPNALLLRANAEFAMGQPGAAAADFKQVLVLHPASADAALGLARIITPTDPAAAETLLGAVVVRGNPTAAIWNNLGVARDLLGRHAEAQQAYAKALQLDPDMIGAQANLARSLSLTPTER